MTQPSAPTLTPVVGVPATITNLTTLRGQATFDGPYLGGPVGAGIGSIPFEWDTASSGWKNSNTDGPLELPLARGDVLAAAKPHGWLYIDLTWTDEAGRRQSEQLRFRPAAGEDGKLDLTRDQDPEAYTTTASLQALTADAEQAAAAANTAAGRVTDAILDLSAERQAVADIIADTAQTTEEMRTVAGTYNVGRMPTAGDPAGVYRVVLPDGTVDVAWNGAAETGRTPALATLSEVADALTGAESRLDGVIQDAEAQVQSVVTLADAKIEETSQALQALQGVANVIKGLRVENPVGHLNGQLYDFVLDTQAVTTATVFPADNGGLLYDLIGGPQ
ncbi:hypothetical protein [Deinococcus sp. 12RED42]|uniref:hypothetical protein n=1 Tax=Deinococcus sp. 12RED42 TaxID=2745872 RepID=UPI001E288CB2|nr:hypothetical protein [Deinococcus sp. 12RED42]MCD0165127.1 hypothetical protein [Deinococcus sp. 12RED42]